MRFGKKLALMTEAAASKSHQKPFISHKQLKDILAGIVRCLKNGDEAMIHSLVLQFDEILRKDLFDISTAIQDEQNRLSVDLLSISNRGVELGLLQNKATIEMINGLQKVSIPIRLNIPS